MNKEINNTNFPELLPKNLFNILSANENIDLPDHNCIKSTSKEMSLNSNQITEWYADWKGSPEILNPVKNSEKLKLFYYIAAALIYDIDIQQEIIQKFHNLFIVQGIPGNTIKYIFSNRKKFYNEKKIIKRVDLIKKDINRASTSKIKKTASHTSSQTEQRPFYIANQLSYEGFDELQRLLLAKELGLHVAIDGPPGVGKTQSIIEVSNLLKMNLYTKTCSTRTIESHIISYPVLSVQDGVSVTSHINGPLARAMDEPGIFYGDEFNLLKNDVQKRLNSAFDDRRYIDRNDGIQIKAKSGFWAVISYNPSESIISRDLEDSVADRFIHFHYSRWTPDFKAFVSYSRSKNIRLLNSDNNSKFNLNLNYRGISPDLKFYSGEKIKDNIVWTNFFTGKKSTKEPEYKYLVYDKNSITKNLSNENKKTLDEFSKQSFSEIDLARMLSRFTELLQSLSNTGESPLLKKIGLGNLMKSEDLELFSLHEGSARIEMAALMHYNKLLSLGFNRYLSQSYAVRLVIDQLCYGQYRDKKLRDNTIYTLVNLIAKSMRLFADNTNYNTKMITGDILQTSK